MRKGYFDDHEREELVRREHYHFGHDQKRTTRVPVSVSVAVKNPREENGEDESGLDMATLG